MLFWHRRAKLQNNENWRNSGAGAKLAGRRLSRNELRTEIIKLILSWEFCSFNFVYGNLFIYFSGQFCSTEINKNKIHTFIIKLSVYTLEGCTRLEDANSTTTATGKEAFSSSHARHRYTRYKIFVVFCPLLISNNYVITINHCLCTCPKEINLWKKNYTILNQWDLNLLILCVKPPCWPLD